MSDIVTAREILDKFCGGKDISYKEADAVFKIAYEYFIRDVDVIFKDEEQIQGEKEKEDFLYEWYDAVCDAIICCKRKGNFINTIPLDPFKTFRDFASSNRSNLPESFWRAKRASGLVEGSTDNIVYISLPDRQSMKNLVGTNLFLFGHKNKNFSTKNNYIFEFYRAGMMKRLGFEDYVKINTEDNIQLKLAFYSWREDVKKDSYVFSIASVYTKIMEALEGYKIPFITCGTRFYDERWSAAFEMFVPPRYKRDVERVFRLIPPEVEKFFIKSTTGQQKNSKKTTMFDPDFTKFIESHVCSNLAEREKERLAQNFDKDIMEMTR